METTSNELLATLVDPLAAALVNALAESVAIKSASPYMSVKEASEYIRCKPQRVYDLLYARVIPKYQDGSRVLLKRDDLDATFEAQFESATTSVIKARRRKRLTRPINCR